MNPEKETQVMKKKKMEMPPTFEEIPKKNDLKMANKKTAVKKPPVKKVGKKVPRKGKETMSQFASRRNKETKGRM
jgi:hypothetical protein